MAPKKKAVKKAPSVGLRGKEAKVVKAWINYYPGRDDWGVVCKTKAEADRVRRLLRERLLFTGLLTEVVKRRGK